ncbi:hypothetical protein FHX12_005669 [Rhizobium sp. BK609]|nr:hypothetical protein [Rhizobium sp. BK098]MBB3618647.1 hypothetical protein [Rhizobium sp. BK609]MBB3684355.1 hypothetical protein [Rhizobium sp. BK612]
MGEVPAKRVKAVLKALGDWKPMASPISPILLWP